MQSKFRTGYSFMFAHLLLSVSLTLHGHLDIGLSPCNVIAKGTCIHMYLHMYMYNNMYMHMYVCMCNMLDINTSMYVSIPQR